MVTQTASQRTTKHISLGVMGHMWTDASISLLIQLNVLIGDISDGYAELMYDQKLFKRVQQSSPITVKMENNMLVIGCLSDLTVYSCNRCYSVIIRNLQSLNISVSLMNRSVNLTQTSNQILDYENACLTTQNILDVKL